MAGDKWLTQLVQRCCLAHRSFRYCVPWQMKEWMTEYEGWTKMTTDFFCCKALLTILPPPLIVFFLVAMYAPNIVEKWSNLTLFDAHSCENVWLKVDFTAVASAYPRKNEDDSWRIGLGSRTNLNLTTNLPWTDFPCRWGTANCKLRVPLSMRCLRTENPNSSTPTTDQK